MLTVLYLLLLAACGEPTETASRVQALEQLFATLERDELFSGTVLVADRGEVIYRRGVGLSDREQGTPMPPEAVVGLGSISKTFTAVAIHLLAEQCRAPSNGVCTTPANVYERRSMS